MTTSEQTPTNEVLGEASPVVWESASPPVEAAVGMGARPLRQLPRRGAPTEPTPTEPGLGLSPIVVLSASPSAGTAFGLGQGDPEPALSLQGASLDLAPPAALVGARPVPMPAASPAPAPTTARLGERPIEVVSAPAPKLVPTRREADEAVRLQACLLGELEKSRIASQNRYIALTRPESEAGFGKGVNPLLPEIQAAVVVLEDLKALEHKAVLLLQRTMRDHPLHPWLAARKGLGDKQVGRLLGDLPDLVDFSTYRKLWRYLGYHVLHSCQPADQSSGGGDARSTAVGGLAPRRRRGQKSSWSSDGRKRVWLITRSLIRQGDANPYRALYLRVKAKQVDRTHNHSCTLCVRRGKPPAPVGSPLSAGHQDMRARREVSKAFLRDLWLEVQRLAAEETSGR